MRVLIVPIILFVSCGFGGSTNTALYSPSVYYSNDQSIKPFIHLATIIRRVNARFSSFSKNGFDYLVNQTPFTIKVIDSSSQREIGTLPNPHKFALFFSDTHIRFGSYKARPLLKSKEQLLALMLNNPDELLQYANEIKDIDENLFNVSIKIMKHKIIKQQSVFELMQKSDLKDLLSNFVDPQDALNVLLSMSDPQQFLNDSSGLSLRAKLYGDFFQEVWFGNKTKVRKMLLSFLKLDDPLIKRLVNQL